MDLTTPTIIMENITARVILNMVIMSLSLILSMVVNMVSNTIILVITVVNPLNQLVHQ